MAKQKWLKWVVGIGSISSLAVFLNVVQEENSTNQKEDPSVNTRRDNYSISNIKELKETEKTEREQWISTLDWEEGNWEIDTSNTAATLTPKGKNTRKQQAETRTRRS
ncbi:hypothetical protein CON65_18495 [Bacillus pseudomycoides]|uniref:Uncharacterized protein n=1 Tax=Bacillus pseudomycoides TaxID=64104 RepID=A0AA91V9S9_9BACI|nr:MULTISPECIES: hypothetical protein [Bacillus]PEB50671.1 hypothetical protein COO03_21010 [Bacillus sp. AFS098217]PED81212.1 hypothetical protein CON65_18495 [Bacillus pseudomycoides]PEU16533.1 hypothetical protein CN524_04100 [Bacillus sp. AFS019443]PEU21455.1 hypothetical protein CN525_01925 [Bacillus sp. AFS014408]PFW61461.1 hypothetical protein COL20_17485 [Bacillus sp. AFS075034]